MWFADVYPVLNACQRRGHVLNVFRLKDSGVIRTLQVVGGNSKAPIQEVQEVAEQMSTAWTSVQMCRWKPPNQPATAKICRQSANTKPWWDQDLTAAAERASEARKEPRQHQEPCIP